MPSSYHSSAIDIWSDQSGVVCCNVKDKSFGSLEDCKLFFKEVAKISEENKKVDLIVYGLTIRPLTNRARTFVSKLAPEHLASITIFSSSKYIKPMVLFIKLLRLDKIPIHITKEEKAFSK